MTKQAPTLANTLITKGFWLYFFSLLIAPAGYLVKVMVSNTISIEEVGLLYSVIGFVTILSVYNDLGLTEAVKYFLPKALAEKNYGKAKTTLLLSFLGQFTSGIILAGVLRYAAPWLAANYFHAGSISPETLTVLTNVLQYYAFFFLGQNLLQILNAVYLGFQNTFHEKLADTMRMWSVVGMTLIWFVGGQHTMYHYASAWVVGTFVGVLISLIIFFTKYWPKLKQGEIHFEKQQTKAHMKYALWIFLGMQTGSILGHIDQQMIVYFGYAKQAGYYTNYLSMLNIQQLFIAPLFGFLIPLVSGMYARKEHDNFRKLQNFLYSYFIIFAWTFGLLMIALGPEIATVLFGTKFIPSGELFMMSGWFIPFLTLYSMGLYLMAGIGEVKKRVRIIAIAMVLNLTINAILIPRMGMQGAILATIAGWILMAIMTIYELNKKNPISIQWNFLGRNIIYALPLAYVIWYFKDMFFILQDDQRLHNLGWLLLFGVGYYLIIAGLNGKRIIAFKNEIMKLKSAAPTGKSK